GGAEVVAPINAMMDDFQTIVLSQDWHPANHSSFASQDTRGGPFELVEKDYGPQVLWPDHCVQDTDGAAFHPDLDTRRAHMVVRKGFRPAIDSYSAFYENDRRTPTGLDGYLRARGVEKITFAGLALDYCVYYSAVDAVRLGFAADVVEGACRAIDLDGSLDAARAAMVKAGVALV
ncbi:MAG: bifunctional nicotinamidase/pyrazinamidase, partial [Pseudomonadota bacterium]